jgi:hypothetical protein
MRDDYIISFTKFYDKRDEDENAALRVESSIVQGIEARRSKALPDCTHPHEYLCREEHHQLWCPKSSLRKDEWLH